jgi:GTP-binding protein EngB required for normal cell division
MLSTPLHFNISNEMENHIHLHEGYLYDFQVISKIDKIKKKKKKKFLLMVRNLRLEFGRK